MSFGVEMKESNTLTNEQSLFSGLWPILVHVTFLTLTEMNEERRREKGRKVEREREQASRRDGGKKEDMG